MKQFLSLLFVLSMSNFIARAQTVNFRNAVEYNDFIVSQQQNILNAMTIFNETVSKEGKTEIDAARLRVVDESVNAAKNIRKMPPFKGQTGFRDAAASLFDFYTKVTSTTYTKLIDLMFSEDADRTDKMNVIVANITEEEKKFDDKFLSAQKAFAKAHHFRLE